MTNLYPEFKKDIEALLGLRNPAEQDELVLVFSLLTNSYTTGREMADDLAMPMAGRLESIDAILENIEDKSDMVLETINVARRLFHYLLVVFIDKPFDLMNYDSTKQDFGEFVGVERFEVLRVNFPMQFLYFLAMLNEIKDLLPTHVTTKLADLVQRFETYAAIHRTPFEYGAARQIFIKTKVAGDTIEAEQKLGPLIRHLGLLIDIGDNPDDHWLEADGFNELTVVMTENHVFFQRFQALITFYFTMIGDGSSPGNWILDASNRDDDLQRGYFIGEPDVVKRAFLACNDTDYARHKRRLYNTKFNLDNRHSVIMARFDEVYGSDYTVPQMNEIKGEYIQRKQSLRTSYDFLKSFDISVVKKVFEVCLFQYFGYSSYVRLREGYEDFKRSPDDDRMLMPSDLIQVGHMYDRCDKFFVSNTEYIRYNDRTITLETIHRPNAMFFERLYRLLFTLKRPAGVSSNYKLVSVEYD